MVGTAEVTDPSIADELAVALTEIESLRAENERLRALLGIAGARESEPPAPWEPTLFAPAAPQPAVDRRSSPLDKIGLFRSMFAGRDDVYALRWQNDRSGKAGWSPAVVGEVPCGPVTVISTSPAAWDGVTTVIWLVEFTVKLLATAAPKCTAVASLKLAPVMITVAPPLTEPLLGVTALTAGTVELPMVKELEFVCRAPAEAVSV